MATKRPKEVQTSACPQQPVERAGIKGQHEKRAAAKRNKDEVGHVPGLLLIQEKD
jgi:hypothetical protein